MIQGVMSRQNACFDGEDSGGSCENLSTNIFVDIIRIYSYKCLTYCPVGPRGRSGGAVC